MKIAIHQPDYIPWMGLFQKIALSDAFVFLDDAQYTNAGQNRNIIKGPNGVVSLSVPVIQHFPDPMNAVRTRDSLPWKKKHLKTVEMYYKRAPYFNTVFPLFEALINAEYDSIAALDASIIRKWSELFGFNARFYYSSDFNISTKREEKVIDICCRLGADTYLSGNGARAYQIPENFEKRGVRLVYQNYTPLVYPQLWGEFKEKMSALDYIMNCGFENPFKDASFPE